MQTVATREKRRNALRRSSFAVGQTTTASITSPPTQIDAAARWTKSASSESHDAPASTAECPERLSPDSNTSASTSAGQRSRIRSVSQARNTSAATTA